MGECEILSTPNGKIVEALINDGVKIGISSRGIGSVTEGIKGKIVNEDFKLITFDLVSDPSTRGAFPELSESMRENSQRAQEIVSKHKKDRVLLTMLESKISEALKGKQKKLDKNKNGKLDSEDFKMLRTNEEFPDLSGDGEVTQKDILIGKGVIKGKKKGKKKVEEGKDKDPLRLKLLAGQRPAGAKKANREDSSTDIRAAVIEGFKRACWGDRYDEFYGGTLTKPAKTALASHATKRAKKKLDQRQRSAALANSGQTEDERMAAQEEKARKLRVQQAQNSSTTLDKFADVIRERCWKGYKPVKGKKPYSKGSCKKVSEKKVDSRSDRPDVKPDQPNATTLPQERDGRAYPKRKPRAKYPTSYNSVKRDRPRGPVIGSSY